MNVKKGSIKERLRFFVTVFLIVLAMAASMGCRPALAQMQVCEYWVAPAPEGNNANPGTFDQPWATLEYAAANTADDLCTIWFKDGVYAGMNELSQQFMTTTQFKAINPYQVTLEHDGPALKLNGARNMVFEGFEMRHTGADALKHIVIADRRDDFWTANIVFRNNIFHDSYNNDLLKIHNGARFITVENNIFFNQGDSDQHIDINSVTDIVVQDNIFFNDFAGSGREDSKTTKHFIVVKDSNEYSDGQEGSERITIRRNVFLNWEGDAETFVQIGNDGKPYHEAKDVTIENNLMIGNAQNLSQAAFGVRGAKNVRFVNNTVVGDLPSKAYAFWVSITRLNPVNEDIIFYNNIWSDPTGSMGADLEGNPNEFSNGDPSQTTGLVLENNLYWNGDEAIPPGDVVSPLVDDIRAVVGDPQLNSDQTAVLLPRWQGSTFLSGNKTIRQEFVRLVETYGHIPPTSAAINLSDLNFAPADDILGRQRGQMPELGAYEYVNPSGKRQYMPLISAVMAYFGVE